MTIGHHVDVSDLTDDECNQIIDVISKDILIRKTEKERAKYLNKKFEDLRREILIGNQRRKKRYSFDDYCLICGKHLFTFCCFLHRGVECVSCEHFCCTNCRKVLVTQDKNNTERIYICDLCLQKRHLKFKTSEWFYELFQKRFKRFGSAKVLRAIYKQRKSIEPRVITLLALCRVIQPTRIHSVPSLTLQQQKQKDSSSPTPATSPFTTPLQHHPKHRSISDDSVVFYSTRRRSVSESEKEVESVDPIECRIRSSSEADIVNIRESIGSSEAESSEFIVVEKGIEQVEEGNENEPLIRRTKRNDSKNGSGEDDGFRISQCEESLDEWIAEGYETTVVDEARHLVVRLECDDVACTPFPATTEETKVDDSVECSSGVPLVQIVSKERESLDKDDYDEVNQKKR